MACRGITINQSNLLSMVDFDELPIEATPWDSKYLLHLAINGSKVTTRSVV